MKLRIGQMKILGKIFIILLFLIQFLNVNAQDTIFYRVNGEITHYDVIENNWLYGYNKDTLLYAIESIDNNSELVFYINDTITHKTVKTENGQNTYHLIDDEWVLAVEVFRVTNNVATYFYDDSFSDEINIMQNSHNITINSDKQINSIDIIDINGSVLKNYKPYKRKVIINNLERGCYILKVVTTNKILNKKIIIY